MLAAIIYSVVISITLASLIFGLLMASSVATLFKVKVPFVPTPAKHIVKIIDLFQLKPGSVFYDIGCGDGRFLIEAEKRGAKAIGFEVAPWAYVKARFNLWRHHSHAMVFFRDFYTVNLADADAVFCFLIDKVMARVEQQLQAQLRPNTLVVSFGFAMPHWQPELAKKADPSSNSTTKIYIYLKK